MADGKITVKLGAGRRDDGRVKEFIKHLYDTYPTNPMNPDQFAMLFGEGEDQKIAVFDIKPSKLRPNTAMVNWVHTYPQRQGVGTTAFKALQDAATRYGVSLELYPWQHGRVSQSALIRFYKKQGFRPINKGGKDMMWKPADGVDEARRVSYTKDYDPDDEFYDPEERSLLRSQPKTWEKNQRGGNPTRHKGKMEYVDGYDSYFYTSGHILDRDEDPERHVREEDMLRTIADILHRHMRDIMALPRRTKFMLRTTHRRSVVVYKTAGPNGKDLYVLMTVLPPGARIPSKIKHVFAESKSKVQ